MGAQTEQEVKRMNQKCGVSSLREACRRNTLNRTLEKYIQSCRDSNNSEDGSADSGSAVSRRKKALGRFPNIAGFCRYYHIGIDDLEELAKEHPVEINRIYAILEDEALNSGLPPAILSAYLKKRLGYDKDTAASPCEEQMTIRFEHNIFDDGE